MRTAAFALLAVLAVASFGHAAAVKCATGSQIVANNVTLPESRGISKNSTRDYKACWKVMAQVKSANELKVQTLMEGSSDAAGCTFDVAALRATYIGKYPGYSEWGFACCDSPDYCNANLSINLGSSAALARPQTFAAVLLALVALLLGRHLAL